MSGAYNIEQVYGYNFYYLTVENSSESHNNKTTFAHEKFATLLFIDGLNW